MAECGYCRDCKSWDNWGATVPRALYGIASKLCIRCHQEGALFFPSAYEEEGIETAPDFGCVQWEAKA